MSISNITLAAKDESGPTVSAPSSGDLAAQTSGWVRGSFQSATSASDDSGVCDLSETVGSSTIFHWVDTVRNTGNWTQCDATYQESHLVDTSQFPNGPLTITATASDAASPANVTTQHETIHVDNAPVTIALSGPTGAPSTAGTQYVTANVSVGPSGATIFCSVDGGAQTAYAGTSARIPVEGLGRHTVSCFAQNNALDSHGTQAVSSTQTFYMTIQQPTAAAAWFPTNLDAPICRRIAVHRSVPARTVLVRHGGRVRRLHVRRHVVTRKFERCHLRVRRARVTTWRTVKRHGRTIRIRHVRWVSVAIVPRAAHASVSSVPYNGSTLVAGWLGTADGIPLTGQQVTIIAAPDDGQNEFAPVGVVTTGNDGSWTYLLPPGPGRLIEAAYAGTAAEAPVTSAPITVRVPSRVRLHLSSTRARWGGAIRITGRVLGSYVPRSGELVLLRIGWQGGSTEIGHLYTNRAGYFSSTYRFLRGNGTERYAIWAVSTRESDYPYEPSASRHIAITVRQR